MTTSLALPTGYRGRHTAARYRPRHRGFVRPRAASYYHPRHLRATRPAGRHKAPQAPRPVRPVRVRPTSRAWGVSVCVVRLEHTWSAYCCVSSRAGSEALSSIRVIEVSKRAHTDVDYAYVSGYREAVAHTTHHHPKGGGFR